MTNEMHKALELLSENYRVEGTKVYEPRPRKYGAYLKIEPAIASGRQCVGTRGYGVSGRFAGEIRDALKAAGLHY